MSSTSTKVKVKVKVKVKPILKWVGGKAKLLDYIINNLPENCTGSYYEPFVGGCSVILRIIESEKFKEYTVCDINESLINVYTIVKENVNDLIKELKKEKYSNISENYYKCRERFNHLKIHSENFDDNNNSAKIEMCALFIFLNKCGFNGMYRENSKGLFNIPFGKMKNPTICDEVNLKNVSGVFNNVKVKVNIECCDYSNILELLKENDFVYLDPPYHGTFTDYTNNKFGENEQVKLKEFVDVLTTKKVNVMISNSSTEFIKELYKDYKQIVVETKYTVGVNREKVFELLITNY